MTLEQLLPGAPGCIAGKKGIIFDFDGTLVDSMRFWDMYTDKDYSFRAAFMKEKYDTCVTPKPGARELLAQTPLQVSEIARSVGYDDPLQFSRFFKAQTGVSPLAYRKNHSR